MIELLGKLIGFLFFGLIVYLICKHMGTHPDIFELEEGETLQDITKGDYWIQEILWKESQNSGEFAFTNKRIIFKGTFFSSSDKFVSIPYSEIASIEKSFVGLFFPFAFTVKTKDDKKYKFAMMKRNKYIDLIGQLAQKN